MSNDKKSDQLGMPFGTASNKLKKNLMFRLVQESHQDICFRCGTRIETANDLSIEHKTPWLDNDPELFWDLDNIAFSHLSCNSGTGRRPQLQTAPHGSQNMYIRGCRCELCSNGKSERDKRYRAMKQR